MTAQLKRALWEQVVQENIQRVILVSAKMTTPVFFLNSFLVSEDVFESHC